MQILPAATKLGQGNIFTGVCLSTGGSASVHAGIYPPDQTLPPPPSPRDQTLPEQDPPQEQTPPRKQTPAYGQRAAGTHPTGMHSCNYKRFIVHITNLSEHTPPVLGTSYEYLWMIHSNIYLQWSCSLCPLGRCLNRLKQFVQFLSLAYINVFRAVK